MCDVDPETLSAFADDALTPAATARVEAHLAACVRCRETLGAWRALGDALRATPSPPPAAVEARLRVFEARRRVRRVAVRAAAAVLVAAGLAVAGDRALRDDAAERATTFEIETLRRQAAMASALECEVAALRLQLAVAPADPDRRRALEARFDDLFRDVDRVRDGIAAAR
ncbi:MAG TPA: zf-HC2 domain-containing protein [Planctomycetota bacterium]|nr:zf-HC2 domain-containing protein [Planctomycetota bacterium]